MKGTKPNHHTSNHNQTKNTQSSKDKTLTPFSKLDSTPNLLNQSSTKLSTRQSQLINQIVETIMLKPQPKKSNVDKSSSSYQLCVTSSNGKQDYHNVSTTSKILSQEKRFQDGALKHLPNDHTYLNRDNIDQYKRIRKIQRLKLFSQRQLEEIVNIINQSFLFMADPEEYDIAKMKQILTQHVSISQYPIAKSAIGQELIKDGMILLSIIEILAYFCNDQMLYKYKAFNTMSNLQIETHYDEFWESAKTTFFIVNSSNKQKIDIDEQSFHSLSQSGSQTSSNQSSKKSQEDNSKNLLTVDWKPIKSATQQQSNSKSKKKNVQWNHASQPVQSTHSLDQIQEPLGSCYTYKMSEQKGVGIVLKQVRKSARIREQKQQKLSKQKNNTIIKKQVEQKQQIQQWIKNSRPSQIKIEDCVHDKIDLFQALTPQDLQIKKLFEEKVKEKNIGSSQSEVTNSVSESSSEPQMSQSQTSSSSLSDTQRQKQVYGIHQEQAKQYHQQQQEQQQQEQPSQQQKQQEINRSKKLQDQAKRQQKSLNVARFINRPFNPESPSKIIYEVDQEYRQSSSHYKNLATSNKAVYNSSAKRMSQQQQRILKRETQKNHHISSSSQNEQMKPFTQYKKNEEQKDSDVSPIQMKNPFLKVKQSSPIFIEPIPSVKIINANQATQKSPLLKFSSKKVISKQHLKRPTYIIRYQQISKEDDEDVQFTSSAEIKKQQSVKKVHFNDQLLTTVNWYQTQSNSKSKSKPKPTTIPLVQQQQKQESPLKQSLLNFSLSTNLNSQQKSISNSVHSNNSNDSLLKSISPSKQLIESTIHQQCVQIKQFTQIHSINNQQQKIVQESKQINYSFISPSKQITTTISSQISQSKQLTNRNSKKIQPCTHIIQNNDFKQTYQVINDDVVITRESKKQEQQTRKINFKVEEIQMVPLRLICANLNGNNNYALIELDSTSAFDLGTKYTFVPLRMGLRLDRRQVLADHNQGIRILQTDDIGYIGLTPQLKDFIEREGKLEAQRKSKQRFYNTK